MDISSVEFDLSEWIKSADHDDTHREWQNADQDRLSLVFFPHPDPSPVNLNSRNSVRQFARTLASGRGADVVEAEAIDLAGVRILRVVFKYPMQPSGFAFTAGYSFKVGEPAYSITFQCLETGMTGARETLVALGMDFDSDAAAVRSNADDPSWDSKFPDHPLSRLRRHMQRFENTLVISNANQRAETRSFTIFKKGRNTTTMLDTADFSDRIVSKGDGDYLKKRFPSLEDAIQFSKTLIGERPEDIYYVIDDDGMIRETVMDDDFQHAKAIKREEWSRVISVLVASLLSAAILFLGLSPRTATLALCGLTVLHVVLSYVLDFEIVVAAIPPIVFAVLLTVAL